MAEKDFDFNEDDEKKGGKKKLVVIVIVSIIVIVAAAAGVIFFMMGGQEMSEEEKAAQAQQSAQEAYDAQLPVYFEIERPFVMNYMIKERQRYLQISLAFKIRDKKLAAFLEAHEPTLKTFVNKVLASQDFLTLRTVEGKEELREILKKEVDAFIRAESEFTVGIDSVLYTNFVMQ